MGLRKRAFIEIEAEQLVGSGTRTALFEIELDADFDTELKKDYLIGNFGQKVDEVYQFVQDPTDFAIDEETQNRRVGYSFDAGAGTWGGTLSFESGLDDVVWGDQNSDPGPGNITKTDASGEGVDPIVRQQVLNYWLAKTRSDSFGYVRIHVGEWTDGSVGGVDAGVYGQPFPVQILEANISRKSDKPSAVDGNITYRRTQFKPGVVDEVADWVDENVLTDPGDDVPDE